MHGDVEVIPNGTRMARLPYESSQGNMSILFAGPFRYPPNLGGITIFLQSVYPGLKERIPNLELVILGGRLATQTARTEACFQQPGVIVCDQVSEVEPYLRGCALTINPLIDIRGSSIKLIESLAAGRVCVSTVDGARGFLERYPSLIAVDTIEDFAPVLERLILDEPYRLRLERPSSELLNESSWDNSGRRLLEVYRKHFARGAQ